MTKPNRKVVPLVLLLSSSLSGCADPEREQRVLREGVAGLPQDTTTPGARQAEPEASLPPGVQPGGQSGSASLPDNVGFYDEWQATAERPTPPAPLTPTPPVDTRPWVPLPEPNGSDAAWTREAQVSDLDRSTPTVLMNVRTARNDGFDRIVFEFDGAALPAFVVDYAPRPVHQCGSGQEVALRGGGSWLLVRLEPSQAHDAQGQSTVRERSRVTDFPILREMRLICDYEGQVEWLIGLSRDAEFRTAEYTSPARLVLDVRH